MQLLSLIITADLEARSISGEIDRARKAGRAVSASGWCLGGRYHIAKNRIYVGAIPHRDQAYPGLHPPIIERALFERVQKALSDHRQGSARSRTERASPLAGKLVDQHGEPLIAAHSCKGSVRYRYYVSRALQRAEGGVGLRIPALEIERLVSERISSALADPLGIAPLAGIEPTADWLASLSREPSWDATPSPRRQQINAIVRQVQIGEENILIDCDSAGLAMLMKGKLATDAPTTFPLVIEGRPVRVRRSIRMVHKNGAPVTPLPETTLTRHIARARALWSELRSGEISISELAEREGINPSYASRLIRLAFLAPAVVEAAMAGKIGSGIDAASLRHEGAISLNWNHQVQAIVVAG